LKGKPNKCPEKAIERSSKICPLRGRLEKGEKKRTTAHLGGKIWTQKQQESSKSGDGKQGFRPKEKERNTTKKDEKSDRAQGGLAVRLEAERNEGKHTRGRARGGERGWGGPPKASMEKKKKRKKCKKPHV